ncbi:hypothetical protein ACGGAI_17915 [Streptomyces antibioticus]|uniref:hypothetical protein n=1 Tax=Streptomyces antibioticus TaxID=1890 RepID=UPI00371C4A4B
MTAMNAMELEIGLYDWSALRCRYCKSAAHVPADLLRLARVRTIEEILSGRSKGGALMAYWLVKEVETAPVRVEWLLRVARHMLPEDLFEDDEVSPTAQLPG